MGLFEIMLMSCATFTFELAAYILPAGHKAEHVLATVAWVFSMMMAYSVYRSYAAHVARAKIAGDAARAKIDESTVDYLLPEDVAGRTKMEITRVIFSWLVVVTCTIDHFFIVEGFKAFPIVFALSVWLNAAVDWMYGRIKNCWSRARAYAKVY